MSRFRISVVALCAAALVLLPFESQGYTHFLRYINRDGALVAVQERFDVDSLPGGVVPFTIAKSGPESLADGDSFAALLSQVRAAAEVWNSVATSRLRLQFAGLAPADSSMQTPHVEVIFDEVPPGLVALGGPVTRGELVERNGDRFFPIVKSQLVLPKNLKDPARPSSSERLFLTLVHEFGHTVGLQHAWASGVMSTEITRATTKAAPLNADDRAGISALYPVAGWSDGTGTITGRVTVDGAGVHLASVVALPPTGSAVSALTGIDGTYQLRGLPKGEYFVYAQPAPPSLQGEPQPVNLELPLGPDGPIAPGPLFNAIFYPGTERAETKVSVESGKVFENINFAVSRRGSVNIHSVQTYSFIGIEAQKPAVMYPWQSEGQIVLFGFGLSSGAGPVDGLSASVIGGVEPVNSMQGYAPSPIYLDLRVGLTPEAKPGVRHLRFQVGGESHIAPSAYRVSAIQPPVITSVVQNGDGTFTVGGERLTAATSVKFDGVGATILAANDGKLTVRAPASLPGHSATVTAYDTDGQSSLMVVGNGSPRVVSSATEAPRFHLSGNWIEPGVETIVELTSDNADFTANRVTLGFGTSDVAVKKIWTTERGKALAWVITSKGAPAASHTATFTSGLAVVTEDAALAVTGGESKSPYIAMSAIEKPAEVFAGVEVVLPVGNLGTEIAAGSVNVTVGGLSSEVVSVEGARVRVRVPSLRAGVHMISMTVGGQQLLPAAIEILDPPPSIIRAQNTMGTDIAPSNAPAPEELFQLVVNELAEGDMNSEDVQVRSGDLTHKVILVMSTSEPRTKLVVFMLAPETPRGESAKLTVTWNGRTSSAFEVPVRH